MATPEGIWIDDDGAGWGWAVVSCQLSVVSCQLSVVSGQWAVGSGQWGDGWISTTDHGQLTTAGFSLLTVVTHELGHAIGLGHEDHGLMAPSLAAADHVVAGRRTAIGELTDSELAAGGRELLGGRALVAASGRQMQDDAVDQVLTDSLLNRYRIDAVDDEEDFAGIERASQRDAEHDQLDLLFAALATRGEGS